MSIRELTCIGCPMGCQLTAVMDGSRVTEVTGNTWSPGGCLRPEGVYPSGPAPLPAPSGSPGGLLPVVSVRTRGDVPKERVLDVARALCPGCI